MAKTEIIEALVAAELGLFHGAPFSDAQKAAAGNALAALRLLDGKERVSIHEEIKRTARACVGIAA